MKENQVWIRAGKRGEKWKKGSGRRAFAPSAVARLAACMLRPQPGTVRQPLAPCEGACATPGTAALRPAARSRAPGAAQAGRLPRVAKLGVFPFLRPAFITYSHTVAPSTRAPALARPPQRGGQPLHAAILGLGPACPRLAQRRWDAPAGEAAAGAGGLALFLAAAAARCRRCGAKARQQPHDPSATAVQAGRAASGKVCRHRGPAAGAPVGSQPRS